MKKTLIKILLTALFIVCLPTAALGFDTSADTQMLLLINSEYTVSKDFKPADLVVLDSSIYQNGIQYMRAKPAAALKLMLEGVQTAGHGKLTARSGYRSFATQSSMFNSRLAERQAGGMSYQTAYANTILFTAYPGTSEHQAGFAMDVSNFRNSLNNDFGETSAAAWLKVNSWRYGFILRYDEAKYDYTKIASEPWHFRYVGAPHAQIIFENGWCLEEYIAYLHENRHITLETADDYVYEIYWTDDASDEFENIVDISSDNAGGWIITTRHAKDILAKIPGNWAEQSFNALLEGKTFAYPHVINPNAAITRADFAMLYDLLGEYLYQGVDMTREYAGYSDVPDMAYYYDATMRLGKAGVMVGSGGKFDPNANITREATATAIANMIKDDTIKVISYTDIALISGWAFQSVQKVTYHNLMIGTNGAFNPQGKLTWAEAATIIHRLKAYLQAHQAEPADEPVEEPEARQIDTEALSQSHI